MVTPCRTLIAAAFVLAAAPRAFAAPPDDHAAPTGAAWVRPANGCGTPQINRLSASKPQLQLPASAQRTIYLNRNGGTYVVGGATSSSTNHVNGDIIPRGGTIAPLRSGFNWASIVTCVKQHYAPYNIKVTETEPTSGVYVEAVVGGDGTEVGFSANELFGIASADNFCGVTESGIAFSFSETHRGVPRQDEELCATIAHEVGHLLTLEHETMATDLMSYVLISDSSTKTFNNASSTCGVEPGHSMGCSCGGSTTNSGGRLTSALGLRSIETVPPSITLESPGDADALTPTFEVVATATDDMAMQDVTVYLNGFAVGTDFEPDGDEYRITVNGAAEGDYTLRVEATDQAGNTAHAEVMVSIARRAIGEDCLAATDCTGGVCASSSDGLFCTEACDPGNDSCPAGFTCSANAMVCGPDDSGGCCSTGGSPASAGLLVFGVGLLLVRRRRVK